MTDSNLPQHEEEPVSQEVETSCETDESVPSIPVLNQEHIESEEASPEPASETPKSKVSGKKRNEGEKSPTAKNIV